MTTKTIQCPHCGGEQKDVNFNAEQLEQLKKDELVIYCKNCGLLMKVNVDENPLIMRLNFLKGERQQKCVEMEQIAKQKKSTGSSSILHAILGDGIETHMLEMQQMNARLSDIQGEIRRIDFEIQQLQSEIDNKGTQNTQTANEEKVFCRYCGIPNEADAVFCKKCGKKIV
jgi:transcription elongation factor Elf1/ribosomal protein L40E